MRPLALLAAFLLAACSSVTPTPTAGPSAAASPLTTPARTPAPATATPAPTTTLSGDAFGRSLPADTVARLEGVLASAMEGDPLISISAAVLVPGVGYWEYAAGLADRENEVAATPDTAYAIGGITHTFVAALVLRLVEDGYLDLDDPAADHLGPLGGEKSNGATVEELLGHRSGIGSYYHDLDFDRPWTLEELLANVGAPEFHSGGQYSEYSPTNYLLLGTIAEVVTGGPLGQLLHEYLLNPLGLERTYYTFGESVEEPIAHGYDGLEPPLVDVNDGSGQIPFANAASISRGNGAMASTAPDLVRWMEALCAGELLGTDLHQQMFTFGGGDPSGGQGLGVIQVNLANSASNVRGHYGGDFGYGGFAFCQEETGTIAVVLTTPGLRDPSTTLELLYAAASHAYSD